MGKGEANKIAGGFDAGVGERLDRNEACANLSLGEGGIRFEEGLREIRAS